MAGSKRRKLSFVPALIFQDFIDLSLYFQNSLNDKTTSTILEEKK